METKGEDFGQQLDLRRDMEFIGFAYAILSLLVFEHCVRTGGSESSLRSVVNKRQERDMKYIRHYHPEMVERIEEMRDAYF